MTKKSFHIYGQKVTPATYLSVLAMEGVGLHFSESGEDITLYKLLRNKKNGFYVDLGAFHPHKLSNTYILHRFLGWRGINLDVSPEAIELFEKDRPDDININIAVGDANKEADLWLFEETRVINTLSEKNLKRQLGKGKNVKGTKKVKVKPLSDILNQYLPERQTIDLMNIDVEGWDFEVLKSNNWDKYRPNLILIEDYSVQTDGIDENPIKNYLNEKGYRFISHTYDTSIYGEEVFMARQHSLQGLSSSISNGVNNSLIKEENVFYKKPEIYERSLILLKSHPEWKNMEYKFKEERKCNEAKLKEERKCNKELTNQLHEVVNNQFKIFQIQEKLGEKREFNNLIKKKIEDKESKLREVKSYNSKLISECEIFEKKRDAITKSRTWRYTLPLRKSLSKIIGK